LNVLDEHPIGEVYVEEPGFNSARDPDTVRAPRVALFKRLAYLLTKRTDSRTWLPI
jgi:hypothetical protein